MTTENLDPNLINGTPPPAAPAAPVVVETAAPAANAAPPAAPPSPFYTGLPQDWRAQVVAGIGAKDADAEKLVKHLERYTDLPNALKAGYEAAQKIRQGLVSTGLPENPSPEELTAYREARGIPPEPSKYELKLSDGLQMIEEDTRIMGNVYEMAHKHNISNEAMNDITNAFMRARQVEVEALQASDAIQKQEAIRVLKQNWGGDFQTNMNAAVSFVKRVPESIRGMFEGAVMPDGRSMLNSPEIISFFASMEREINPTATVVPNSANPVQAVNDELAALDKRMRTDPQWYKDAQAQKRYMDLVSAKERIAS